MNESPIEIAWNRGRAGEASAFAKRSARSAIGSRRSHFRLAALGLRPKALSATSRSSSRSYEFRDDHGRASRFRRTHNAEPARETQRDVDDDERRTHPRVARTRHG